jgi:hypothetical protein
MPGYIIATYLLMAIPFLSIWLNAFRRDTSLSARDRQLSLVVLAVATVLWPVVVPISYLELLKKKRIAGGDRKFAH